MSSYLIHKVYLDTDDPVEFNCGGRVIAATMVDHGSVYLVVDRKDQQDQKQRQNVHGKSDLDARTYHTLLDYLCEKCHVPGHPTFWDAVATIARRLDCDE